MDLKSRETNNHNILLYIKKYPIHVFYVTFNIKPHYKEKLHTDSTHESEV